MTAPLDPERWTRVGDLFDAAARLPAADRAAYLAGACDGDAALRAEVESLLAFDRSGDTRLEQDIRGAVSDAMTSLADTAPPVDRLGPYRLREEIGRGGMGTVYRADRDDDFTQRVAIKIVRGFMGNDALRRFRAERQILASLNHPGIAQLLDGGTTPDGLPYLVMEYVDGVPIDEYCEQHALTVRQRLGLFVRVCEAVSYAHRSLVVHRDLKPSNILVVGSSRVDLQACKLEYSIVSPK